MSTYTQILYQIVFSTKNRERTLKPLHQENLYVYIAGIVSNNNCHTYWINGTEDHLHMAISLHPSVPLSSLVKSIKLSSSNWIKENSIFPFFIGWQEGYGAFTYSYNSRDDLVTYIKNQKQHHLNLSFIDEYKNLLEEHNIRLRRNI